MRAFLKSSSSDSITTTSSSSSSSPETKQPCNNRCAKYLIPDTIDLVNGSSDNVAQLENNRRKTSWDGYLYDAALEKWGCEQDRLEMRQELLEKMKAYYGNQRWQKVDSIEDVELYNEDEELAEKQYLDSLVLYGEHNQRRSRYVDRQDHEASKCAFKRRRLNAASDEQYYSGALAFLRKMGVKMGDEFERLHL